MNISRRNALIGLATLAGGAGALTAAGAFDTVEATRNFELEVAGDAAALLGLAVTNDQVATIESGGAGGSDIIAFELDASQGLNENAVTDFWEAFEITNNGSEQVHVSIDLGLATGVEFIVESDRLSSLSTEADLADGGAVWDPGEAAVVDIKIDTTPAGGYTEPGGNPYSMTITATTDF